METAQEQDKVWRNGQQRVWHDGLEVADWASESTVVAGSSGPLAIADGGGGVPNDSSAVALAV